MYYINVYHIICIKCFDFILKFYEICKNQICAYKYGMYVLKKTMKSLTSKINDWTESGSKWEDQKWGE